MGRIYDTQEWRRVKYAAHERDGWRCRKCGKVGALEAHHLTRGGGADPYDLAGIVSLCLRCHSSETEREREGDGRSVARRAWDAFVGLMEA